MQELKERGNDQFKILVLQPDNFKLMVSRGYIKEIGNITFLYDKYTNLWSLVNSDFHCVSIPTNVRGHKLWYLFKTKNKIFGGRKFSTKPAENVIELSDDQVYNIAEQILMSDYSFKDVYNALKDQLGLGEYTLPDKDEDKK